MKQLSTFIANNFLPVKTIIIIIIIVFTIGMINSAFTNKNHLVVNIEIPGDKTKDSIESVQAFKKVYKVLVSPRCVNCHPSGDVPLQGDDSHLHTMFPKRGVDGKGLYAMKCANCHQPANIAGLHTPPGNPKWHLPPAGMKMVFQGKTPHQLAKQLVDPKQNGFKNKEQLISHASDELVMAAWNPGEGRTIPPMSHEEFTKAWVTWIKKGAYAPR